MPIFLCSKLSYWLDFSFSGEKYPFRKCRRTSWLERKGRVSTFLLEQIGHLIAVFLPRDSPGSWRDVNFWTVSWWVRLPTTWPSEHGPWFVPGWTASPYLWEEGEWSPPGRHEAASYKARNGHLVKCECAGLDPLAPELAPCTCGEPLCHIWDVASSDWATGIVWEKKNKKTPTSRIQMVVTMCHAVIELRWSCSSLSMQSSSQPIVRCLNHSWWWIRWVQCSSCERVLLAS